MIRAAKPDDMAALLEMGRAFNEEAGYAETVPFDPESFGRVVAVLGQAGLVLVAEERGNVVAMAAADVAGSVCNQNIRFAREAFWYVRPEHRPGKVVGRPLLDALECTARNHGASFFDVVAEEGKRSEALARLYRGARFSPTERVFRKAL